MNWNIQGLSSSKVNLVEALLSIHLPEIVCLNELHLTKECMQQLQLSGYKTVSYFWRSRARGGSAIFARSDLADDCKSLPYLN